MQGRLEGLARFAYRRWKLSLPKADSGHPDEETLSCFLEGRLGQKEAAGIKEHLVSCHDCAEAAALGIRSAGLELKDLPAGLIETVRGKLLRPDTAPFLEIVLRLKDRFFEIVNTTGDILLGQELLPAPVLRSRSIKGLKDEIVILKDFEEIRLEIKVQSKGANFFDLSIIAKDKKTQKPLKDLRITLIKEDLELESYLSTLGSVSFEHVVLGKYRLDISNPKESLASVLVDINI